MLLRSVRMLSTWLGDVGTMWRIGSGLNENFKNETNVRDLEAFLGRLP